MNISQTHKDRMMFGVLIFISTMAIAAATFIVGLVAYTLVGWWALGLPFVAFLLCCVFYMLGWIGTAYIDRKEND